MSEPPISTTWTTITGSNKNYGGAGVSAIGGVAQSLGSVVSVIVGSEVFVAVEVGVGVEVEVFVGVGDGGGP